MRLRLEWAWHARTRVSEVAGDSCAELKRALRCRRAETDASGCRLCFEKKKHGTSRKLVSTRQRANTPARAPAAPAAGQTGVVDMTGAKERFARAKAGIGDPPKGAMDGIKKVRAMGTQTVPFS